MAGERAESAVGQPLEKHSAGIAMDGGGDFPGAGDGKFANLQLTDLVLRNGPPLRLSTDATRIHWHDTSRWCRVVPLRNRYALAPSIIRRTEATGRWRIANRGRRGR